MAGNVSKNARRQGEVKILHECGGEIKMHTLFKSGKVKHFAQCEQCGQTARRPRDLSRL